MFGRSAACAIDYDDWRRIDAAKIARGGPGANRARSSPAEMLAVLD